MIGVNDLLWTEVPLHRTVKWRARFFTTVQQASQFCSGHEDDKPPISGSFVVLAHTAEGNLRVAYIAVPFTPCKVTMGV